MEQSTIDCLIAIASYIFAFGFAIILEVNKRLKRKKIRR